MNDSVQISNSEDNALNEQKRNVEEIQQSIEAEIEEGKETKKKYRLTPKFLHWVQLFTDKANKETFGNQTRSALVAYELDESTQYTTASVIGRENYVKLRDVGSTYLEKQGITFGKMIDIAVTKMATSDKKEWYDEVAFHLGMPTHQPKVTQATQNNLNIINIMDPKAMEFNKKFLDFIEKEL